MEQAVQTEVVLESLFKFTSFQKLKELRLVCKYWNKLASAELRKRSNIIPLGHSPSLKKLYNLELCMKNKDITARIPLSVHIQRNGKNDWKILKDIATYESWRTRVAHLDLYGFSASDLNRLLPFLFDQLPLVNRSHLVVGVSNPYNGQSIVPVDFSIPQVSSTRKFSLTSLMVAFLTVNASDDSCETLDLNFLRQCHSLKYFSSLVWFGVKETVGLFERLNELHSEDNDFLASCDEIRISIRPEAVEQKRPLATLARFVNNTQPRSLDISDSSDDLNLVYFLDLLQVEKLRAFIANVPSSGGSVCFSNWLMKTLKKFKIFSQLEELHLKPFTAGSDEVPEIVEGDVKHNLDKVTTLKVGFDPQAHFLDSEKFKCLLEDAAHNLRNVTRLELLDLRFCTVRNPTGVLACNLTPIFEGIRQLNGLRELLCDIKDLSGELQTIGIEIAMMGCKGLLEPLSLLSGSGIHTFTLNVKLSYDLNIEMVLMTFFMGYEPKVKLNLNLKTEGSGQKSYQYSKEELKETLDKICNRSR